MDLKLIENTRSIKSKTKQINLNIAYVVYMEYDGMLYIYIYLFSHPKIPSKQSSFIIKMKCGLET